MCHLPKFDDPRLLVGFDTSDDAAVYQIDDHTALIQTVDLFPPVVDDPGSYGQIAAANSLSDVYAMGGEPKLAMNILCIPEAMDPAITREILAGGYAKVKEADAIICGGHTIKDNEPKYGLCVSGFVHPQRILKNCSAREGDVLVLTKALGTGILNTAATGGLLEPAAARALSASMTQLNKDAAHLGREYPVSSCTDITGFGLLGHACEMAVGSHRSLIIDSSRLPLLPQALAMAEMGIVPKGAYDNRSWLSCSVSLGSTVSTALADILFDPQTSGGLLFSLPEADGLRFARQLSEILPVAGIVGYVESFSEYYVKVR